MTTLFRYPKTKHVRNIVPPTYKRYQSYKKALRLEFGRVCVYCRWPDTDKPHGHWDYAVEHYRPKKKGLGFEHLERDYANLFYACAPCNVFKGEHWADTDFVPNPCDEVMFNHLQVSDAGEVNGKSTAGTNAVKLLHLNEPDAVRYRKKAALTFSVHVTALRDLDRVLARVRAAPDNHPQIARIKTLLAEKSEERALTLEVLTDLCGTVDARNEVLESLGYRVS